MSGLRVTAAAAWRQTIDGADYWLEPLALSDWAVLEQRVVEMRRDPLQAAKEHLADLDPDDRRALLEAALSQAARASQVTATQLLEFAATAEGTVMLFWLAVRKRHPHVTLRRASELLDRLGAAELARLRTAAEGQPPAEDPIKN